MIGRVTTRVTGSIGEIIISNPDRKNAMSNSMWRELRDSTTEMQANDYARVVIIRGSDSTFVAGADITEFREMRGDDEAISNYFSTVEDALLGVFNLTKPTIAAIEGHCIGGGVSIAAACDFRVSTQDAVFQIPSARLGLSYPGGSLRRIVNLIGITNAKYLIFTANAINARAAKTMNLITDVVEDDIRVGLDTISDAIIQNAPLSIAATKKILNALEECDAATDDLATQMASLTLSSRDFNEAINAFDEKRRPNFIGR